jgi:hypothetical protein
MKNTTMLARSLRVRVERLLRGDFRPEDLNHLFLYLRAHSHGAWSIVEVGDFIAHRDRRKKGPVTQAARDFFYASRCLLPPGKFNDLLSIPSIFPEAMNAQLRRIDSRIIQRYTGLREK